jgi:hypothetical protein
MIHDSIPRRYSVLCYLLDERQYDIQTLRTHTSQTKARPPLILLHRYLCRSGVAEMKSGLVCLISRLVLISYYQCLISNTLLRGGFGVGLGRMIL